MSWILLLIELIPAVIRIINFIMALIKKQPLLERKAYRQRLFAIAKTHVKKRRGGVIQLSLNEESAIKDLEALESELKAKLGMA